MITIKISDEQRFNLLVSALSGGIRYWAMLGDDAYEMMDSVVKPNKKDCFEERFWMTLKAGKAIPIRDVEDDKVILGKISLQSIEVGEQLMADKYKNRFSEIITEDGDSITADVWFQLAVMKNVVYG